MKKVKINNTWIFLVIIVALIAFLLFRRRRMEGFQNAKNMQINVIIEISKALSAKYPTLDQLWRQLERADSMGNPAVTNQVKTILIAEIGKATGNNNIQNIIDRLTETYNKYASDPKFAEIINKATPLIVAAIQNKQNVSEITKLVDNAKTLMNAIPKNLEQAKATIDKISAKGGIFGLINSPTGQNIRTTVGISQEDIQKVKDKVGQGVGLLETGCSKMPDVDAKLAQAVTMIAKAKDVCSDIPDWVRNRSKKIRDGCGLVNNSDSYIAEIQNRLGQVKQACGEIDGIKKFIG
jgi:hypothetical protein